MIQRIKDYIHFMEGKKPILKYSIIGNQTVQKCLSNQKQIHETLTAAEQN